ncbi:MAG: phosphodiesterase, family protein [Bacillales bacterium]|jgi:putative phosphoesterase|nr:phosphodiesterase, family protein [Bacillales bacterium]
MKILIISDTHGEKGVIKELNKKYNNTVAYSIHCGDSELKYDDPVINNYYIVKGNCDFFGKFEEDLHIKIKDLSIFITHGHRYNVKSHLYMLEEKAQSIGANIVCFGHSHLLGVEKINGILYINPGSLILPRGRKEGTYVILEENNNELNVQVYNETHELIKTLNYEK